MDQNRKPINRVAKIIKVGEKNETKTVEEKETDHSTIIFILTILIIIACFLFYIIYIYAPNNYYAKEKEQMETSAIKYYFNVLELASNDIDSPQEINVENFKINLVANENKFDIIINNHKIGTFNKLNRKVAIVDNILFVYLKNNEPRQNKLIGYSLDNEIIYDLYNIENVGGMVIEDVVFNPDTINIVASRIYDNRLILSSNYGDTVGRDLCLANETKNILISGNYELTYQGNKKFNDLVKITGTYLEDYIAEKCN